MSANDHQVGGNHYRKVQGEQHWDRVWRLNMNYFQAMVTRYVERYRDKNGIEDLKKARHFLDKLIELEEAAIKSKEVDEGTISCKSCKGNGCPVCDGQGTIYVGEEDES